MKKITIAVLTFGWLTMGAGAIWAYPWDSPAPFSQEQKNQMRQAWRQYMDQTLDERAQMATKTEQLFTLLAQPEPDRNKITALQKEIITLRASLEQKAVALQGQAGPNSYWLPGRHGGYWAGMGGGGHYGRHGGCGGRP
jgi:TolA-binding protein